MVTFRLLHNHQASSKPVKSNPLDWYQQEWPETIVSWREKNNFASHLDLH